MKPAVRKAERQLTDDKARRSHVSSARVYQWSRPVTDWWRVPVILAMPSRRAPSSWRCRLMPSTDQNSL